jgi:hypothetical protein
VVKKAKGQSSRYKVAGFFAAHEALKFLRNEITASRLPIRDFRLGIQQCQEVLGRVEYDLGAYLLHYAFGAPKARRRKKKASR